jgi:hypothetical protein
MAVWLGVDFMSTGGFNTYKIAAAGVVAVYPALFIFAFLVIGYALYSRAVNREDAAAQAKADKETAAPTTTDKDS